MVCALVGCTPSSFRAPEWPLTPLEGCFSAVGGWRGAGLLGAREWLVLECCVYSLGEVQARRRCVVHDQVRFSESSARGLFIPGGYLEDLFPGEVGFSVCCGEMFSFSGGGVAPGDCLEFEGGHEVFPWILGTWVGDGDSSKPRSSGVALTAG